MRIYDFPFAPNPKKLRVYLAEKGLTIPLVKIDLASGEHRTPEFLKINPMGALPVLELEQGIYLSESLTIIEYLEELNPKPAMIGDTPLSRARVRQLERFIEISIFNPIGRVFFNTHPLFQNRHQVPGVAEQARQSLPKALDLINQSIGQNHFVAGPKPTIADCTLYAALEHAERAEIKVPKEYENLLRWHRSFSERPSAVA